MIEAVAVVVPARDEEDRVVACLRSVLASVPEHLAAAVVLVADGCVDRTAVLARAVGGVHVVEVEHGAVGAARRDGVAAALARLPGFGAQSVWIANTDADTIVPAHWLLHQVALADEGADVVIGTVRPDFDELPPEYRAEWLTTHRRGKPNGHVHGANLGFRASAYAAAGGYRPDREHEDTRLVQRLSDARVPMVATDGSEAVTSGRLVGRTPGGYAGFLRRELDAASRPRGRPITC